MKILTNKPFKYENIYFSDIQFYYTLGLLGGQDLRVQVREIPAFLETGNT